MYFVCPDDFYSVPLSKDRTQHWANVHKHPSRCFSRSNPRFLRSLTHPDALHESNSSALSGLPTRAVSPHPLTDCQELRLRKMFDPQRGSPLLVIHSTAAGSSPSVACEGQQPLLGGAEQHRS